MNIIIYARVSDPKQAESGLGLQSQIDQCRRWIASQDGAVEQAIFSDEGISGARKGGEDHEGALDRRTGLLEAISSLEEGDALLVAKRSRLCRDNPVMSAVIDRLVHARGARIISAAGEGNGPDPASQLFRRIIDAINEYEVLLIRARTRAALKVAKAQGALLGQVPYGVRRAEERDEAHNRLLVLIDDEETETVQRIFELRDHGLSLRAVAATLNEEDRPTKKGGPWRHSSVQSIIQRADNG